MCGRYFLDDTKEANERLLNLLRGLLESGDPLASQVHTGEIFPTQLAPVIVADGGGVGVRAMRWGLSARWRPGRGHQQPFGKGRFYPHVPARGAGAPLPGCRFPAFTNGGALPLAEKRRKNSPFNRRAG